MIITDAMIRDATMEYLSHRGERPNRVLRGGYELWETHADAMRAAITTMVRLEKCRTSTPLPHDKVAP